MKGMKVKYEEGELAKGSLEDPTAVRYPSAMHMWVMRSCTDIIKPKFTVTGQKTLILGPFCRLLFL